MGLLFALYPIAEIYAWYTFIDQYSFLDALGIVASGVLVGWFVIASQGRSVMTAMQNSFGNGVVPAQDILQKGLVMLGGLLIMAPGLICKFVGAALVIPGLRHVMGLYIRWILARKMALGEFRVFANGFSSRFGSVKPTGFSQSDPLTKDVIEIQPTSIEHREINK